MVILKEKYAAETLACLIIDDPLLRPQYGCLNYKKLLQEMKRHNFFTELAFIPWNYRRSDLGTTQLFIDNPDYFGICIHGCNHTFNEFGERDYQILSALSSTALWRMEEHKKITGLTYDPVMVFPQGHFSSEAMLAIKDQGYHAAFNSTLRATDRNELSSTEYHQPATKIYHDFPLFLRRYPKDKAGILQDLALGRPIIIVEHHGAFKNGYKTMTDFIDWVNGLGNIKWKPLSFIVNHYYGGEINVGTHPKKSNLILSTWEEKKIALRRFASEFRDTYIEPSNLLTKTYRFLHDTEIDPIDKKNNIKE